MKEYDFKDFYFWKVDNEFKHINFDKQFMILYLTLVYHDLINVSYQVNFSKIS